MSEALQWIPALAGAIAAIAAAIAAWRMPISAAKHAESLRLLGAIEEDKRRFKYVVFSTLMQERARFASEDAVKALNLIDIVFADSVLVREAWSELYLAFNTNPLVEHVISERIRKLLREMSIDIGISDKLRIDDFGRVYFPNALAKVQLVRELETDLMISRLRGQSPSANTAGPEPVFPPKPET